MASTGSIDKINSAMDSVSKGENLREEMMLITGPHINWEDFIAPAPMCVCLLGKLMALSAKADFTLANSPPKDGFRLMQWPNSFRASLMQVSNSDIRP